MRGGSTSSLREIFLGAVFGGTRLRLVNLYTVTGCREERERDVCYGSQSYRRTDAIVMYRGKNPKLSEARFFFGKLDLQVERARISPDKSASSFRSAGVAP